MRIPLALVVGAALAAPAAASQEQVVRCAVSRGSASYSGWCVLLVEDGRGSFGMAPADRARFFGRVHAVQVNVLRSGRARVRGYSREGEVPRPPDLGPPVRTLDWGFARRSPLYRACWIGRRLSVCTY